jgi:hypothetical protein
VGVVVPAARLEEIRKPVEILAHPVRVSGAAIPSTNRLPQALEAAPIGGQLFAHDNSQRDCTAF